MRMIIIALLFLSSLVSGFAVDTDVGREAPVIAAPSALETINGVVDSIIVAPAIGTWMTVATFNDLSDPHKGATELEQPVVYYADVNANCLVDANGVEHEVISMVGEYVNQGIQITIVTKDRPTVRTLYMTRPEMAPLAVVIEVDDTLGVIKAVFVNVIPLK